MNATEILTKLDVDGNGKVDVQDVIALAKGNSRKLLAIGIAIGAAVGFLLGSILF
jgi:hypothetical protein